MSKRAARSDFEKAANIIRDCGGRVVGRTRLQKIAYLLELAGVGEGFHFEYRHYGPYSEDLTSATQLGELFETLQTEERRASWGGAYSVYTANRTDDEVSIPARKSLARIAVDADPIELELAATAAFLQSEGVQSAWEETKRRKPEKASSGRIARAKELYAKLQDIETPRRLPKVG
ncbi:MAG: hypothetical protein AB7F74_15690 [Parvibaculaceae bacterium]